MSRVDCLSAQFREKDCTKWNLKNADTEFLSKQITLRSFKDLTKIELYQLGHVGDKKRSCFNVPCLIYNKSVVLSTTRKIRLRRGLRLRSLYKIITHPRANENDFCLQKDRSCFSVIREYSMPLILQSLSLQFFTAPLVCRTGLLEWTMDRPSPDSF